MSNDQQLAAVSKVLTESNAVRAKIMQGAFLADTAAWRRLLLGIANQPDKQRLNREIADRFMSVWPRELKTGSGLDLSGADLSGSIFAYPGYYSDQPLDGAGFQNGRLDDTEWLCLRLNNTDFAGASLRNCFMVRVDCQKTNFREADLTGAHLAMLESAREFPPDFSSANLSEARIALAWPWRPVLDGANLDGCTVTYIAPRSARDKPALDKALDDFVSRLSEEQRNRIVIERPDVSKRGPCFIATAACGTDQSGEVICLQDFRDTILTQYRSGRILTAAYETISPPLARQIDHSAFAQRLVRRLLVRPAASLSAYLLNRARTL